jgi:hypothetical protein
MDGSGYYNAMGGKQRESLLAKSLEEPMVEDKLMRKQFAASFSNVQSRLLSTSVAGEGGKLSQWCGVSSYIDPSPVTLLSMADMEREYEKDTKRMLDRIAKARAKAFTLSRYLEQLGEDPLLNEDDLNTADEDYDEANEEDCDNNDDEAIFEFEMDQ